MFLCCGDSLFDLFVDQDTAAGATARVALAGGIGGSPLNVASGLARLGHASAYYTGLSSDLFGERQRAWFARENIDVSLCPSTDRNTTLAVVELDEGGAARYVFYKDGTADTGLTLDDLPASLPDDVRVLHFGSYSTAAQPSGAALEAFATRESSRRIVSYDPNLRLSVEPDIERWRALFGTFADAAAFVKASDEDIDALYGADAEERFVADCLSRGVQVACITRGPDGASAFDADGHSAHSAGVPIQVVDTVGAGDTFQATALHWLGEHGHIGDGARLQGRVDLDGLLSLALKAAAITCTRRGADLPTRAELTG